MRFALVCLLFGCGHAPARAIDAALVDAAPPGVVEDIHFIGRFSPAMAFAWPGTQIRTRFSGTELAVALSDTATDLFEVTIDGVVAAPPLQTMAGSHTYPLATGLAPGEHDVVLAKRTESNQGTVTFGGFSGSPLVPTARRSRLIELVGDSITCGYGVLGASSACNFSQATESEPAAWGSLAAAQLQADHVAIAYSGIGMVRNNGGDTVNTMPLKYPRVIADDASSTWDFSYTPDVIVINLGTNDFAAGDPGPGYVTAYDAFIAMLRGHFPAAPILITTSPMVGGAARTTLRGYLDRIATDSGVTVVDIAQQLAADGFGCNFHPNTVTAGKMAATLVPAIRAATGW
jgi:lysophospholipase L1-like esterase